MRAGSGPVKPGDFVCTQPMVVPHSEGIILGPSTDTHSNSSRYHWRVLWNEKKYGLTIGHFYSHDLWLLIPC